MITISHNYEEKPVCLLQSDSPAWQLGTGLPISLAPGTYPITGEDQLQGVVYFRLGDAYRIESCWCQPERHSEARSRSTQLTLGERNLRDQQAQRQSALCRRVAVRAGTR